MWKMTLTWISKNTGNVLNILLNCKLYNMYFKNQRHKLCLAAIAFSVFCFSSSLTLSTYLYFLANLYLPYLSMLAESYSCLFAAGLIVSPTKASEIAWKCCSSMMRRYSSCSSISKWSTARPIPFTSPLSTSRSNLIYAIFKSFFRFVSFPFRFRISLFLVLISFHFPYPNFDLSI